MKRSRFTEEQIIGILNEQESGMKTANVCRKNGIKAPVLLASNTDHVRGAPNHPQTQGKIERWHQTLKNRIFLENYYLPGDLEGQIEAFVRHYNDCPYHESLGNLTPAVVYFGRDRAIIERRERIKQLTFKKRRLAHQRQAA